MASWAVKDVTPSRIELNLNMTAVIPTRIELSLELVVFVLELVVFVLELTALIPRQSGWTLSFEDQCSIHLFTETKRRRSTGWQQGTKSASRPAATPVMNCGWISRQPRVNRESTAGQPRVNRWFCSSAGLHRILLVRTSGETLKQRFFDALENTVDLCFLGE